MEKVIVGIDLGGTNLRIGAVTQDNRVKNLSVIKSELIAHAEQPVQMICDIIADYIDKNSLSAILAISLGVPSSVAADKETVICTTNIRNKSGQPVFSHLNIAAEIRGRFDVPVYVNNDVQNILLYDVVKNKLEQQSVVAGIYIGTGVGAAVLIDGKPLVGKDGVALDLGDIPYYKETAGRAEQQRCEVYASGWRLQQIRQEHYPDTDIKDMFTKHGEEAPLQNFINACAHVFAVMATIFNPAAMIAGGGVIEMENFPREKFAEAVCTHTGGDVMSYGFDLLYSEDFVGKGVIGAAIFARTMLLR